MTGCVHRETGQNGSSMRNLSLSPIERYARRAKSVDSLLCVGLDSAIEQIPARFHTDPHPQFAFNRWIIDQTHPYVSAYKPNMAFYESRGEAGLHDLALTMAYLRETHPDIFTICDAKRADIGSTNDHYVQAIFDILNFDSVTLHPYLGREALAPFLNRRERACIILCRTSNPGAGDVQDLPVNGQPLWLTVAGKVHDEWNVNNNCMLVVGATYPNELRAVRERVGNMPLLVPGVGTQGGSIHDVLANGLDAHGGGLIINVSRSVVFADDPGKTAHHLCQDIHAARS